MNIKMVMLVILIFVMMGNVAVDKKEGGAEMFEYDNKPSREEIYQRCKQKADVLKGLGITGLTDEFINQYTDSFISYWREYYPSDEYRDILSYVGYGNYDEDTYERIRTSTTVYAFDCEIFDISNMYTDFLKGIMGINNCEFKITDIVETDELEEVSYSYKDTLDKFIKMSNGMIKMEDVESLLYESDYDDYNVIEGYKTVSFKYNGNPYTFKAVYEGDWIDLKIIGFMNDVLKKEKNPKRLLCTNDMGQGVIILYNTEEWRKLFTEKTGVKLYLSSSEMFSF